MARPLVDDAAEPASGFNPAAAHLPGLDGLRGVAILLVVVVHSTFVSPYEVLSMPLHAALLASWAGVDLFFALSGFLITSLLLADRNEPRRYLDFYAARFGRIVPLYYALLAVFLLLSLVSSNPELAAFRDNLAIYLPFLGNFGFLFDYNLFHLLGPTWSLGVEVQFYLAWPLLVFNLSDRALRTLLPLLLVGLAALRAVLVGTVPGDIIYVLPLTHADGLLVGSLAAVYADHLGAIGRHSGKALLGLGLVVAAIFVAAGTTDYADPTVQRFAYLPLALFFGCALIASMSHGRIQAVLSNKRLRTIGKYSYFTYLFHVPALALLDRVPLPRNVFVWGLTTVGLVAMLTALGWLSWRLFERPAARVVRSAFASTPRPARVL